MSNKVNDKVKKIKRRAKTQKSEDLPLPSGEKVDFLAKTLIQEMAADAFKRKYAPVASVLKLAGAGAFIAASFALPNLPLALKPFIRNENEYEIWKRFNIPYLKRTLRRLEKAKLVEIGEEKGMQVVKITDGGRRKILRYALDKIRIKKPKFWDGKWLLVAFDLPEKSAHIRQTFLAYLKDWGFYPLQESLYLHAFGCGKEIEFLREYLGIGEYIRIFQVTKIENDELFREFFGV